MKMMNTIAALLLLLLPLSVKAEMLWKSEEITFEMKEVHPLLSVGLILELNQALESGETGWKQSRIDVQES
ncbi:hypothetical protein [Microbulbifer sp. PSTR4-B]|uniref:hypothetical protein n=1 Tax=Microbulbifer sp. PSTR4-B TaxID=3243396 RepID=UPI004039B295